MAQASFEPGTSRSRVLLRRTGLTSSRVAGCRIPLPVRIALLLPATNSPPLNRSNQRIPLTRRHASHTHAVLCQASSASHACTIGRLVSCRLSWCQSIWLEFVDHGARDPAHCCFVDCSRTDFVALRRLLRRS